MPDAPALPDAFLRLPLAHRGLHVPESGQLENSLPAFAAAVAAGYGIELDVQTSRDGVAMVFHDYVLDRLTGESGRVDARDADELGRVELNDAAGTIPTLAEVLAEVAGRVPLLIEIKDQDGALGRHVGALEAAVARDLRGYDGPVAVMSYNPYSVAACFNEMPDIPRGRVTEDFTRGGWERLPEPQQADFNRIDDLGDLGASFISHGAYDLRRPRVSALKAEGIRILTWTIRSAQQERIAREVADNVTFEGYLPDLPH